jgi:hypothetical protein
MIPARAAHADQSAPSCRELATELSVQMTATGGFTASARTTCAFDRETKQVTCTLQQSDPRGSSTMTTTSTYASVADIVDEIAVIPPLTYVLKAGGTQTGNPTPGTVTNSFDAKRRITKTVNTSASAESTTTFTAWDEAGRPTEAQDVGKGFSNRRSISYDNVARTRTTVVNGGPLRTVETFDANGNQIETLATSGGTAIASKTAITVVSSQRVCK